MTLNDFLSLWACCIKFFPKHIPGDTLICVEPMLLIRVPWTLNKLRSWSIYPFSLYFSKTALASIFPSKNCNHVSLINFMIFKILANGKHAWYASQRIRISLLKTSLTGFDIVSYFVSQHTKRCRARFTSGLNSGISNKCLYHSKTYLWITSTDNFHS